VIGAIKDGGEVQPGGAWVKTLDPNYEDSPVLRLLESIRNMGEELKIDAVNIPIKVKRKDFRSFPKRRPSISSSTKSKLIVSGY